MTKKRIYLLASSIFCFSMEYVIVSESSFSCRRYGCCMRKRTSEQCKELLNTFNSSLEKLGKEDVVISITIFNQELDNSIRKFAKEKYNIKGDNPIEDVINQVVKEAANDEDYDDDLEIDSIFNTKFIINLVKSYLDEPDPTQKEEREKELKKVRGCDDENVKLIIQKAIDKRMILPTKSNIPQNESGTSQNNREKRNKEAPF